MKYLKYILMVLLILIDIYIIYQSCLDSEQSSQTSLGVTKVIVELMDIVIPGDESIIDMYGIDSVHNFIRKLVGHFGLFFVIGIISCIYFLISIDKITKCYMFHFLHGILLAIATEYIQTFIRGRAGSIIDVGIDVLGYLISSLFVILIYYFIRSRKENSKC